MKLFGLSKKGNRASLSDRSLSFKICSIVIGLSLALILLFLIGIFFYYSNTYRNNMYFQIRQSTDNSSEAFLQDYDQILQNFVFICGTSEFAEDLRFLQKNETSAAEKRNCLQNELLSLENCSPLVSSALIYSRHDLQFYTNYHHLTNQDTINHYIKPTEFGLYTGPVILSERPNPFSSDKMVYPLVIPTRLTYDYRVEIPSQSIIASSFYIVLLIDSSQLSARLSISSQSGLDNHFLFYDEKEQALNSSAWQLAKDSSLSLLAKNYGQDISQASFLSGNDYICIRKLDNCRLFFVNHVEIPGFWDMLRKSALFTLLLILCTISLLLAVLFILLAKTVSKPINQLSQAVDQIYLHQEEPPVFSSKDEVGKLSVAINTMYHTIEKQLEQIKEDERERYLNEIRLLTEQINPHFLYNTLECIELDVENRNNEVAAGTIHSLADYLRIGLSYGDTLIPISQELRHVQSYIRIMNTRFHQSIQFLFRVSPDTEKKMILKTILQPLTENAVKYGFSIDGNGFPVSTPCIEIEITEKGNDLNLILSDNGAGFDPARSEQILLTGKDSEGNRHIGLHNVYERLCAFYGKEKVKVHFTSMPYYKNTIEILISDFQAIESTNGSLSGKDSHV